MTLDHSSRIRLAESWTLHHLQHENMTILQQPRLNSPERSSFVCKFTQRIMDKRGRHAQTAANCTKKTHRRFSPTHGFTHDHRDNHARSPEHQRVGEVPHNEANNPSHSLPARCKSSIESSRVSAWSRIEFRVNPTLNGVQFPGDYEVPKIRNKNCNTLLHHIQ